MFITVGLKIIQITFSSLEYYFPVECCTTTTARIKNTRRKREMIVCSSKLCNYGVVESREDDNSSITSRAKIKKLCHKNKQNYN